MAVGSFSAGLSGLNANSVYLNVIGNNLANINTIGFKSSAVTFIDLVSPTTRGSQVAGVQPGRHREHGRADQRGDPGRRLLRGQESGRSAVLHARRQLQLE